MVVTKLPVPLDEAVTCVALPPKVPVIVFVKPAQIVLAVAFKAIVGGFAQPQVLPAITATVSVQPLAFVHIKL